MQNTQLRMGKYGSLTGRPCFYITLSDSVLAEHIIEDLREYNMPKDGEGARLVFDHTAWADAVREIRTAFPKAYAVYIRTGHNANSEVWDLCDWIIDDGPDDLLSALVANEVWIDRMSNDVITELMFVPKRLLMNKVIVVRPLAYSTTNTKLDYLTMYALIPHSIMFQE